MLVDAVNCISTIIPAMHFISVLKKMKHRIVEHMSSSTADALGLSRAILCNGKCSLKSFENESIQ